MVTKKKTMDEKLAEAKQEIRELRGQLEVAYEHRETLMNMNDKHEKEVERLKGMIRKQHEKIVEATIWINQNAAIATKATESLQHQIKSRLDANDIRAAYDPVFAELLLRFRANGEITRDDVNSFGLDGDVEYAMQVAREFGLDFHQYSTKLPSGKTLKCSFVWEAQE